MGFSPSKDHRHVVAATWRCFLFPVFCDQYNHKGQKRKNDHEYFIISHTITPFFCNPGATSSPCRNLPACLYSNRTTLKMQYKSHYRTKPRSMTAARFCISSVSSSVIQVQLAEKRTLGVNLFLILLDRQVQSESFLLPVLSECSSVPPSAEDRQLSVLRLRLRLASAAA